jgi:hypothetical protein
MPSDSADDAATADAQVKSQTEQQTNTQQQSVPAAQSEPQSPATTNKRQHSAVDDDAAVALLAELHLGESTPATAADEADQNSAAAGSSSPVCKKQRASACDDAVAALVAGLSLAEEPEAPAATAGELPPAELAPLACKRLHSAVDDDATAALLASLNLSETAATSSAAASQPDERSTAAAAAAALAAARALAARALTASKKLRTAADDDAVAALVASMSLTERPEDASALFSRVMTDLTPSCRAVMAHMQSEEKGRLSGTSKGFRKLLGVPFKWSSLRLSTEAVQQQEAMVHTGTLPFTRLCLQVLSQFR